jgi:hypothetical protein
MSAGYLTLAAVVLVSITSIYILISRDWRYTIVALAIQYIGVFFMVNVTWPIEMAVSKMIAGWMAGAILGIAVSGGAEHWRVIEKSITFGPVFRLFSAALIGLLITSLVVQSEEWLPSISRTILWGGFFLIGTGLLQLSLASNPMRVVIGLLTTLSGFEVLYAGIENSVLVAGLLAGVTLGLAVVGAYLLTAPTMEAAR